MSQVMQIRFKQINMHVKRHMQVQRHSQNEEITGRFVTVCESKVGYGGFCPQTEILN